VLSSAEITATVPAVASSGIVRVVHPAVRCQAMCPSRCCHRFGLAPSHSRVTSAKSSHALL
jgi:hypothetical protein